MLPLKNKTGRREFIIVDPGGNWIRIGQITATPEDEQAAAPKQLTKLARAIVTAEIFADNKGDYATAAKTLDAALAQESAASASERVQALVARAGLAITMDDPQQASRILAEMRQIPLHDANRATLMADLQRASDLEHMLQ